MGVTFHYVDENIKLQSRVLELKFLEKDHDGNYLKACLTEVMNKWGISERVRYLIIKNKIVNFFI